MPVSLSSATTASYVRFGRKPAQMTGPRARRIGPKRSPRSSFLIPDALVRRSSAEPPKTRSRSGPSDPEPAKSWIRLRSARSIKPSQNAHSWHRIAENRRSTHGNEAVTAPGPCASAIHTHKTHPMQIPPSLVFERMSRESPAIGSRWDNTCRQSRLSEEWSGPSLGSWRLVCTKSVRSTLNKQTVDVTRGEGGAPWTGEQEGCWFGLVVVPQERSTYRGCGRYIARV